MAIAEFPPVDFADETGLLAYGGDLEVSSLLLAYSNGIFPWPVCTDTPTLWFAPPKRALLFLEKFHPSKNLQKLYRQHRFYYTIDQATEQVIQKCSDSPHRKGQSGTWITPPMVSAYIELHRAGFCHSVECWLKNELVGGLYGVSIGGMFAGESMFYNVPGASKCALMFLVSFLLKNGGRWIDCQQMSPLLASLGTEEVPREEFMLLLNTEINREVNLFNSIDPKRSVLGITVASLKTPTPNPSPAPVK